MTILKNLEELAHSINMYKFGTKEKNPEIRQDIGQPGGGIIPFVHIRENHYF